MGWDVQVERDESMHEQFVGKVQKEAQEMASKARDFRSVAEKLMGSGMNSIDLLADLDPGDIAGALVSAKKRRAAIIAKAKEACERETAPCRGNSQPASAMNHYPTTNGLEIQHQIREREKHRIGPHRCGTGSGAPKKGP